MRICANRRPATFAKTALAAFALSLTTLSALAGTLDPIRLRVCGKEVALKSPAVTDGRETYLPLESLDALGVTYTLTRREETALLVLPNGMRTEVALARPGRLPMVPLSSLARPLGLVSAVHDGLCEIRRQGERITASPTVVARRDIATPVVERKPGSTDVQTGTPISLNSAQTEPGKKPDVPPAKLPRADRQAGTQRPAENRIHLDLPPPRFGGARVQQPGGVDMGGEQDDEETTSPQPAPPTNQNPIRTAPTAFRVQDVAFEAAGLNAARIRFQTSGRVNPIPKLLADPNRLAIDVPNASLEMDRRDWEVEHPFLSGIHAMDGERPGTTRFVLDLSRLVTYRLLPSDSNGFTLNLGVPRGSNREVKDLTVVVDAGHGGSEGKNPVGCSITTGGKCIMEKHLTLSIAKKLQQLLEEEGATVLMTRSSDVSVPLTDRPAVAIRNNADLFVSVHIDDCPRANSASGTTAYYSKDDPNGRALAHSIVSNIAAVSGLPNRRARSDRERFSGTGMAVLHTGAIPSTLVEIGYINNVRDRTKLVDPDFQQTIAQAMLEGIRGYVTGSLPERVAGPVETGVAIHMR